jgi:hypothetical protein
MISYTNSGQFSSSFLDGSELRLVAAIAKLARDKIRAGRKRIGADC